MENILPRREARENAFLLAFSQTFGDIPLAEALSNHAENDEEHPVDAFSRLLLNAYYDHSAEVDDEIRAHLRNWTMERLPRVSLDRKSTRLNSSHKHRSRMPSSA